MFTVSINPKTNGAPERYELEGINADSSGYEYGTAIAKAISGVLRSHTSATVEVSDDNGSVIHAMSIVPRSGTMMVAEKGAGTMELNYPFKKTRKLLPEKYLCMVNPEMNNNKFYRMTDLGNGKWRATYGRIGETRQNSYEYPDYMYAIKLQEKILKGYRDKSECHIDVKNETSKDETPEAEFEKIADRKVAELIDSLMAFAKRTIRENYTVRDSDVTQAMIDEAKAELANMRKAETADEFNGHLLELMHIIPRQISGHGRYGVAAMMAATYNDFSRILNREEDLLDVMESQVRINSKKAVPEKGKTGSILDAMGIEVYPASEEQEADVLNVLNDSLKPRLIQAYRVINKKTQKAFDKYLASEKEKTGHKPRIKQLWHGSRNANWISILQNGLVLNPNAIVTGKMFGNGIYFAPSAAKSWGYTSSANARWTNERSDLAFMALFATAYGKPYEVYSFNGGWHGFDYNRLKREHPGCACVHAKKDLGMLHDDEIIFYREDQMTINYICEFRA